MGCLKVLLLLSAAIAVYVKADTIIGEMKEGSKQLVTKKTNLDSQFVGSFNDGKKQHNIIIDRVEIKYNSDAASCEILSGGISTKNLRFRCTPKDSAYGQPVTVTIFGRMNNGKISDVKPQDLKFGPG